MTRRSSSSARNAARSRRSGWAAVPTAAPGTRWSRSAPRRRRCRRGRRTTATRSSAAGVERKLYAEVETRNAAAAVDRHRRVRSRARRRHRARVARACSAASRASASPRCCCRRPPTSRARSGRCCMRRAKSPSIRSRAAAIASASATRRCICSSETCIERILEEIARLKPALVIIDSVQTVFSLKFQSAPGSIGQVREAATQFLFAAKGQNIPTVLVGHVTKDGSLAGPKVLEHVVDTVLYFEGERHHSHRVVRAVKNRFGAVSELGVFEMTGAGLQAGAESVEAVPVRARVGHARVGGAVLRRRLASDPGRGAGARQHQHATATRGAWRSASIRTGSRCCWPCSRSAPGSPGRRRRLREHRRRHDRRRASCRPERRGRRGVQRPQPRPGAGDRDLRRGRFERGGSRHPAGGAADPRSRSRWGSRGSCCRPPTSIAADPAIRGRCRTGRCADRRRGARRS